MTALLILTSLISLVIVVVVLSPFFFGDGGALQDASVTDSVKDLQARQNFILTRWIKDERAATSGEISETEWDQRKRYLTSRYVDAARRIDWLNRTRASEDRKSLGGTP